ncbi:MAG TPA: enoyl-CoA hydratase-related protein [Streptosporangiaceae bacterium]|nr:enoyl-CoA hydratase-related protein [Streptosporangiaceae bacterium]
MPDAVHIERDGTIATIFLNRPERLNAVDLNMAMLLVRHLHGLAHDDAISSVIITGSGQAYCAGGDLGWAAAYPGGPANGLHVLASHVHQALLEIHRVDKPVIAAVNGVAAGAGFSLALACDFRVMDEAATFRQAYTSAGLSIDGGGTFMLPRLVGLARALEIAAFDKPIDAQHAASTGLATRIARAGEALNDARALARELDARSRTSFAYSKRLLRRSAEIPMEVQLELEREAIVACARAAEGAEGIDAFISKRAPDFIGARTVARSTGRQVSPRTDLSL